MAPMSAYDQAIDRTGADALIPEEFSNQVISAASEQSAALSLFPKVTMSSKTRRLPVLSALPVAYWVDGDTGYKGTTKAEWDKKILEAEELATILPIPEAVLEDADFDIWADMTPRLGLAIGRMVDGAVIFNQDKPASFGQAIVTGAYDAGNHVALGTSTQAEGSVAEDVNLVMAKVEADGFDVNGFIADRTLRATLRGARDTTGQKLLDLATNEIEGSPVRYVASGLWTSGDSLVAGDFTKGILGVRRDITYKMLTEAVIQDPGTGDIVYNLAQQDMVALRVTFRCAWQVANPVTYSNETESTRFPFALLGTAS
jgi:HK97 family phage major capsid protein